MPRVSATSAPIRQGTSSLPTPELARAGGNASCRVVMIVSVVLAGRYCWSESAARDAADRDGVQDDAAVLRGTGRYVEVRRLGRRRCRRAGVGFQGADLYAAGQNDPAGLDRGATHDRGGLVKARWLVYDAHREPVIGVVGDEVAGRLPEIVDRAEVSIVLAGHDQHPVDRGALVPRFDGRAVADVRDRLAIVDRDRNRGAVALHPA